MKLALHTRASLAASRIHASGGRAIVSDTLLRLFIGGLWFLDGLLQLQPGMFTTDMVNSIMAPVVDGQPAPIAASLNWIVLFTTEHVVVINLGIALIQLAIGLCLMSGRFVKSAIIASIVWALVVWYAGEGMSLLLVGQGSILTGAPGAVILYPLIALVFYPRKTSAGEQRTLLSRLWLRRIFAIFWACAALLQLQPYWWQDRQISLVAGSMLSPGTLNGAIVDPSLQWFSQVIVHSEIALNIVLIIVFLELAIGIFFSKEEHLRPWLIVSMIVSLLIWWFAEALGGVLTSMGTDVNTSPLLIIMALASWPLLQKTTSRPTEDHEERERGNVAPLHAPSQA